MWSTGTLAKLNAKKKPTKEEEARPKMEEFLEEYGLQITLKTLVDALQKMIEKRGKDHLNLMVIEGLRGLYNGYMRRHEPNEDKEGR
jgi:hypothetical protein